METKTNPNIEVADIFSKHKDHLGTLSKEQWKVVQDIINCRTAALGGHTLECDNCGHLEHSYNSCRNRHCPKCQFSAKTKWLEDRKKELLPVSYFHLVFTLPAELNNIILQNKRICYNILFKAASETLKEVALNPKNLGAQIGFFMVLHTWGQNLMDHPHVHTVAPAGGISPDGSSWIDCKKEFFLPVKILSIVFRGKYLNYLEKAYKRGELEFHGRIEKLENEKEFKKVLINSANRPWVVYAKKPFAGPEQVLDYLGNYTHRIAISNHRLIKIEDDKVHFYYRDYADDNKTKIMTLNVVEFMRRFLLHVLPAKFMKIRHYGLLGSKYKKEKIEVCRKLIGKRPCNPVTSEQPSYDRIAEDEITVNKRESAEELMKRLFDVDIYQCKKCKKGRMNIVGEIKAFNSSG